MATTFEQTALRDIYTIAFQVSPIILEGGMVADFPGGLLPIVALLGGLGLVQSAIAGQGVGLNDFSFYFRPMPGSTIINQSVATYPFANQRVAANATIQEPTNISLTLIIGGTSGPKAGVNMEDSAPEIAVPFGQFRTKLPGVE